MPVRTGAAQNVFPKTAVPVRARAPVFTKVLLLQFICQFLRLSKAVIYLLISTISYKIINILINYAARRWSPVCHKFIYTDPGW